MFQIIYMIIGMRDTSIIGETLIALATTYIVEKLCNTWGNDLSMVKTQEIGQSAGKGSKCFVELTYDPPSTTESLNN